MSEAGSSTGGSPALCPECGGELSPVAPAVAGRWQGHSQRCQFVGLGPGQIAAQKAADAIDRPDGPPEPEWLQLQRSVTRLCTAGAVLLEELVRVGAPLLEQLVAEMVAEEERLRQRAAEAEARRG